MIVPAHRRVIGTVAITETKLEVPYTVVGDYVYDSGFRVARHASTARTPAPTATTCRSVSQEFNLDGTPSAKSAPQPAATLLQQR